VENMTPRQTDEFMIGISKAFSPELSMRGHVRYRKSSHFWEDTNNDARFAINAPANIANQLYIENLNDIRAEIGGSSYVIADLDGGFTKFYEASIEANWNSGNWFLSGSYTWSHYYGNFDQDNTTTGNDAAIFIGSSNIADDPGRQLWDFKKGDLSGDRRHLLKLYGYYRLPWNARVGAYFVAQSGQPWEKWDVEVYRDVLTAYGSGSTSSTIRFGEPAGSRTSDAHYQLDLNYTQNFRLFDTQNLQLRLDLFNVFDKQTGYAINSNVYSAGFGDPFSFYRPRRLQVALKYQF
ncbi:MAG: carboxypeptidase regulatory-like domain-containing protein, partial [Steroidobacteraceae bacterium]